MMQPSLFDLPPRESAPYVRHSETSKAAAESIAERVPSLRDVVLRFIRGCADHGATDEDVCAGLNMQASTARPRRIELVQRGLVRDSGRKRATRSGRMATVWEVAN